MQVILCSMMIDNLATLHFENEVGISIRNFLRTNKIVNNWQLIEVKILLFSFTSFSVILYEDASL